MLNLSNSFSLCIFTWGIPRKDLSNNNLSCKIYLICYHSSFCSTLNTNETQMEKYLLYIQHLCTKNIEKYVQSLCEWSDHIIPSDTTCNNSSSDTTRRTTQTAMLYCIHFSWDVDGVTWEKQNLFMTSKFVYS